MRYGLAPDEPEFVTYNEACQLLANAIITRAALDLRALLQGRGYYDPKREEKIQELERFFHSDYYALLTDLDGDIILHELEKEVYDK